MKKNHMMRLAAVLLVLVLLSTCVISGTFAKYTTAETATDSATVAKWGIKLSIKGDNAVYDDDQTTKDATVKVLKDALAAPGTYEKLATVSLKGTPEVAYEIKVDAKLELDKWTVEGAYYCPLVITVDGQAFKGTSYASADEFEAAVIKAINKAISGDESGTKQYDAGTPVSADAETVLIDWSWAFKGAADSGQTDVKDTALGNATEKATIAFSLTVTVTQVD